MVSGDRSSSGERHATFDARASHPRAALRSWSLDLLRVPMLAAALSALLVVSVVAPPGARASGYDPVTQIGSMYNTTLYTGAAAWWDAGYTGAGVDVALIDTGVSPVKGLDAPGKVIHGPDLSLESQAPNLAHLDTSGHGTFMAGLIAGRDPELSAPYALAPASAYRGMAPDARIVSVKVGVADGGTDVSQVIAAIYWVIQHRNDNGLNIRVLNLSYGTNSPQDWAVDPLAYAVERAWKAGIVVVAAAGNSGYQKGVSGCLANPAFNPWILAVGGTDPMGTAILKDDKVGAWSSGSAKTCRILDFVAPGAHLQGLRVPNSFIDATHPEGVIDARYFRGSGTSQAAAIASGAIALVLDRFPSATPDQVKRYFHLYALGLQGVPGSQQGAGEIRLATMLPKAPGNYVQRLMASTGLGSLDQTRGSDRLTRDGVTLAGEQDIFGQTFDSAVVASLGATGSSWSGGEWNGSSWSGSSWSGSSWSGSSWSGSSWSGSSWSGSSWSGSSWSGSSWSSSDWSGSSWSGSSWSGGSWATGSWD